jgi:hypothetical protein
MSTVTCQYVNQKVEGDIPSQGSLRWALLCPAIRAARGIYPETLLTCPVRPEMPHHYGCVNGMRSEYAERYDSFNGAGSWSALCSEL